MTIRLGACAFVALLVSFTAQTASAACGQNDLACQKFSGNSAAKTSKTQRKRATYRTRRKTRQARRTVIQKRNAVVPAIANATSAPARFQEPMSAKISTSLPTANLIRLQPGAIKEAPENLPNLKFGTGDQVEIATVKCSAIERSNRRVTCAVAVHRLALTSEAGAGCVGSLGLRKVDFVKSEEGNWINEDSIALCGGRLLRRTELFPVSINGTPHYALREEYQMLGGDRTCAAPYLKSRRPLRKSYMPGSASKNRRLQCGAVASR